MNSIEDLKDKMLPHIRRLKPYHGVDPMEVIAERAGIPAEQVIRLNGNENPYGPSPKVNEALGSFQFYNHYTDPEQRKLRSVLSKYLGAPEERIVAGNGSDELIDLLLRMFLGPGENIIIPSPTFGMYSFTADICGGEAVSVPSDENFEIDVEAMVVAMTDKTKAVFLASPNNPSGNIASSSQIRALLETGRLIVVDETYYEFCGQSVMPLMEEYPNLVILRTFSKWAGLAGLRIGLGVMQEEIAQTMISMKPPYNVNTAAEVALTASLEDTSVLLDRVKAIVAERERMMGLLQKIPGIKAWPSQANFILFSLPEGQGERIFEGLCNRGIFLRYFNTPQLKDFIRSSVGFPHETDAVVAALTELVEG
ncbi:MAG TPA: histidinol-phosphate transaminase [Dehalococcoidia bacterium]|jgi:histidinol-phosphate aminotransferase|nr:histidinol-phosphate transaminase [Dehalococcoidia bacterium]MEE2927956.1 histidinol-phosphate transaminase [Chloroflexota bacterium]HIB11102.1 histidinol-phosphate transaminase [Dehalococcoidia bacterium]HIM47987.1 histidinol-phosphate transaminase [Dehalococcoidia bacterium]